jgi:membrane-associated phospholipid phosphatase
VSLDVTLLLWINQGWADPGWDIIFQWLSARAWFSLPLLLGLLIYLWRGYQIEGLRLWLLLILGVILGDMLGNLLKEYFAAPRPCYDLYQLLRPPGGGDARQCAAPATGMPSNHALNFFAVATFLAYALRDIRLSLTLYAIAIGVGLSRIYLAKHYPSQVLAGAGIGIAFGLLYTWLGLRSFTFGQRFLSPADALLRQASPNRGSADTASYQPKCSAVISSPSSRRSWPPAWVWLPLLLSLLGAALVYLNHWNEAWFCFLNRLGPLTSDRLWASLTLLGDTLVAFALLGPLIHLRGAILKPALITIPLATLWVHGLKPLLDTPRPLALLTPERVHLIGEALYRESFPSGHSTTAFALAGILVLARVPPLLAFSGLLLATLAALSRVVVGAHWPLDILGGMFGGWLSALLGLRLAQWISWQPGRHIHAALLWFCSACALALLFTRELGYPQAIPLQMLVGFGCLCYLLWAWRGWQPS